MEAVDVLRPLALRQLGLRAGEIERELGVEYGTDLRVIYTATELRATAGESDTIAIDGEDYKLVRVESWTLDGETTYRAYATRKAKP
jgi:hypothetical protein